MNRRWTWVVAVTGMALATEAAWASWACVPQIQHVAETDLLVAGKMGRTGDDFRRDAKELGLTNVWQGKIE
jgi:hypothetical protein